MLQANLFLAILKYETLVYVYRNVQCQLSNMNFYEFNYKIHIINFKGINSPNKNIC